MIKNVFVVDMLMTIQIWWVWQDRTHKLHPGAMYGADLSELSERC